MRKSLSIAFILLLGHVLTGENSIANQYIKLEKEYQRYSEIWDIISSSENKANQEKVKTILTDSGKNSDPNLELLLYIANHNSTPFQESIDFLNEFEEKIKTENYHPFVKSKYFFTLGFLYEKAKDKPASVIHLREALEIVEQFEFLEPELSLIQIALSRALVYSSEDFYNAIQMADLATQNAKKFKDSALVIRCLYNWGVYMNRQDEIDGKLNDYSKSINKHLEALSYVKKSYKSEEEKKNMIELVSKTVYPALASFSIDAGKTNVFDSLSIIIKRNVQKGYLDSKIYDFFLLECMYNSVRSNNIEFARKYYPDFISKTTLDLNHDYLSSISNSIRSELVQEKNPKLANEIRKTMLDNIIKKRLLTHWHFQSLAKSLINQVLEYETYHSAPSDSIMKFASYKDTLHIQLKQRLWNFNNEYYHWAIDVKHDKNQEINNVNQQLKQERRFSTISVTITIIFILLSLVIAKLWKKTANQSKELINRKEMLESFNNKLQENNIELKNLNQELERVNNIINSKNLSLNLLNSKLEQTNKSLDMYAKVIAHDLKAPLKTSSQLLSFFYEDVHDTLSIENRDVVLAVSKQINKTTELIQDILDFNRMKKGNMELEYVDLNELVEEVKEIFQYEINHNKAEITIENLPNSLGYTSLFKQLFLNLINNAIKYKKQDGPALIKVTSRSFDKNMNVISVSDNGIGISEENQPRIFGLFQKIHNNQEYEGYGIGLATCQKIVNNLDGDIWVESTLGEGTTFYFTLPKLGRNDTVSKLKNKNLKALSAAH